MNVKFLNPFVEAAYEVLLVETGLQLTRGQPSQEKAAYYTDEVTVILSLIGRLEGNVFYGLTEQTALYLAARILDEKFESFNSLAQSGIAELGNVITGRAGIKLADAGYATIISPPSLLVGKGAQISTLDMPRLVATLESEHGAITIHLALRDSADRSLAAQLHSMTRPAAS